MKKKEVQATSKKAKVCFEQSVEREEGDRRAKTGNWVIGEQVGQLNYSRKTEAARRKRELQELHWRSRTSKTCPPPTPAVSTIFFCSSLNIIAYYCISIKLPQYLGYLALERSKL